VKSLMKLVETFEIKGMAHITGGGFIENIPRMFTKGLTAKIDRNSYEVPPVFKLMQKMSGISDRKIYNTFNMGIGMVLAVDKSIASAVISEAIALGENACLLGEVVLGDEVIL
ncbi:MAG: AIR synthase-related protein, partial [Clostridia bacterium]